MNRIVAALSLALFGYSSIAHACECVASPPGWALWDSYNRADLIFTGTVIEARGRLITFQVGKVWKGAIKGYKTTIGDPAGEALSSCDYHFEATRTYLVYANKHSKDRGFYVEASTCSGTLTLSEAGEKLAFLEDPKPPTDTTKGE
jgi:hypothetical protein